MHLMREAIRGLESTGCMHLMREAIRGLESTGCMHLGVGKGVRVEHTA